MTLESTRRPVWHRIAAEMARNGYRTADIAEEFGCTVGEAQAFVDAADIPDRRKTAAHAERMRQRNADPVFAAAHAERMRQCHADPVFAAAHAERMRQRNADPVFAAAHAERMRQRYADPAYAAKVGRLPNGVARERAAEYRALRAAHGKARALEIMGIGHDA